MGSISHKEIFGFSHKILDKKPNKAGDLIQKHRNLRGWLDANITQTLKKKKEYWKSAFTENSLFLYLSEGLHAQMEFVIMLISTELPSCHPFVALQDLSMDNLAGHTNRVRNSYPFNCSANHGS